MISKRIKELRNTLHLSQELFGGSLGVTGAGISKIESGQRKVTEQTVKAICREFNVNHQWLTTGQGEMFASRPALDSLSRLLNGDNEFATGVLLRLAEFTEQDWEDLKGVCKVITALSNKGSQTEFDRKAPK